MLTYNEALKLKQGDLICFRGVIAPVTSKIGGAAQKAA